MKRILQMSMMLWVCLPHLNAQTQAQDLPRPRKNSVFLEGLGNGIAYSINYDHLFSMKEHPNLGAGTRIGVSHYYVRFFYWRFWRTTLPAELYFSYGKIICLELGLGYTTIFEEKSAYGMGTFRLGFRYRGPQGFMAGVGMLNFIDYGTTFSWPQFSIGFTF